MKVTRGKIGCIGPLWKNAHEVLYFTVANVGGKRVKLNNIVMMALGKSGGILVTPHLTHAFTPQDIDPGQDVSFELALNSTVAPEYIRLIKYGYEFYGCLNDGRQIKFEGDLGVFK
jgi:hypothetical protein